MIFRNSYGVLASGGDPWIESSTFEDGSNLLFVDGSAPVLTGCVLEAGSRAESRGRVRVFDSEIEIDGCTGDEGGIVLNGSSARIRNTELSAQEHWPIVYAGGGGDPMVVTLENCDFSSGRNGVSWSYPPSGSRLEVAGCTFRNHGETALAIGGAPSHVVDVRESDIRGSGGGVSLVGSQLILTSCSITGNRYSGVRTYGSEGSPTSVVIEDCTIAGNGGSTYYGSGLSLSWTEATVRHSVVWGNCATSGPGIRLDDSVLNLECSNVDLSAVVGNGTVNPIETVLESDPLFCVPEDCALAPTTGGIYTLRHTSPALHQECGVMGGLGAGCFIATAPESWGKIKSRYR